MVMSIDFFEAFTGPVIYHSSEFASVKTNFCGAVRETFTMKMIVKSITFLPNIVKVKILIIIISSSVFKVPATFFIQVKFDSIFSVKVDIRTHIVVFNIFT